MSEVISFNIIVRGTLAQINQKLDSNMSLCGTCVLVVPNYLREELQKAVEVRSSHGLDEKKSGIYDITNTYEYGFDILDSEGSLVEIADKFSTADGFILMGGIAGEPREAEPQEEVKTVTLPPDVKSLTTDNLFSIVANYDDIHKAAVTELNSRIATIKDKLAE